MLLAYWLNTTTPQSELAAAPNVESLESQLQAHFRSRNVVYALLVQGAQELLVAAGGMWLLQTVTHFCVWLPPCNECMLQ